MPDRSKVTDFKEDMTMSKKSILLAVNGSRESLFAAEAAWSMAQMLDAKVTAQTVIDIQALWQLIGPDLPGIIGSGPYIAAHDAIDNSLKSIAQTLKEAYDERAEGYEIDSEFVIDEGNTVSEIFKRAKQSDLVVVGHRSNTPYTNDADRKHLARYSLAELLSSECPCPLLIVQDRTNPWTKARLVIGNRLYDEETIASFLDMVWSLGLLCEISYAGRKSEIEEILSKMEKKRLREGSLQVVIDQVERVDDAWRQAWSVSNDTLLVVPTDTAVSGERQCAGDDVNEFVRNLNSACALILPPHKVNAVLSPIKTLLS
jgi:nucleotide-binding universal stress UspA family protein